MKQGSSGGLRHQVTQSEKNQNSCKAFNSALRADITPRTDANGCLTIPSETILSNRSKDLDPVGNRPFDPTIDRSRSPTGIEQEQIGSIVDELTTAFNRVTTFSKRRNTKTQRYDDERSNEKQDFSMITGTG